MTFSSGGIVVVANCVLSYSSSPFLLFDAAWLQAKDNRKVNLLTSLCSCNGKAITSNQDSITKMLFTRTNGELYMPLKLDKQLVLVLPTKEFFPPSSHRRWVDIRLFFADADIHLLR